MCPLLKLTYLTFLQLVLQINIFLASFNSILITSESTFSLFWRHGNIRNHDITPRHMTSSYHVTFLILDIFGRVIYPPSLFDCNLKSINAMANLI